MLGATTKGIMANHLVFICGVSLFDACCFLLPVDWINDESPFLSSSRHIIVEDSYILVVRVLCLDGFYCCKTS